MPATQVQAVEKSPSWSAEKSIRKKALASFYRFEAWVQTNLAKLLLLEEGCRPCLRSNIVCPYLRVEDIQVITVPTAQGEESHGL